MSEIQPALTADAWNALANARDVEATRNLLADTIPDGDERYRSGGWHALAALCLYQQPFGFVRFHVDLLTVVADKLDEINDDERAEELRCLCARIAALLPPDDELPSEARPSDG